MSRRKKSNLKTLDKRILERLQQGIPFVSRPWQSIARDLNIEEDFLMERIGYFKKIGLVRRISATFNPRKVGFVSTLVAASVNEDRIDSVAKKINVYDEVTHNYKRDDKYNLWFTLVAKNKARVEKILKRARKDKDIKTLVNLPALRLFKINVNFKWKK